MTHNYLFFSKRLGFRNWEKDDLAKMQEINADREVMAYFPSTQTEAQTMEFMERMKNQYSEKRYCYFAVDKLETEEFIGFIGLSEQNFEADFTPCVDIGWRLAKKEWGKGFATEGAKRCLQYAFEELKVDRIYAMAPAVNLPSLSVMKKIGMESALSFEHPRLMDDNRLRTCMLYVINNNQS